MRTLFLPASVLGSLALVLAAGCSSEAEPTTKPPPRPLPLLSAAPSTLETTRTVLHPSQSSVQGPNPAQPAALASYLERGFGDFGSAPGEASSADRALRGAGFPAMGPNARRLVRFVHLADFQIADDESPGRLATLDSAGATAGAARPQDPYLCHMANAAVRTINALHRSAPLDFVLMGGDNADSAQTNEVDWVLSILNGAPSVECDSGNDDDMVPGPDNDGKDAFVAEGLQMPWKWVSGNHDVHVQGNVLVDEVRNQIAVGNSCNGGTRNYSVDPSGPIELGDFVIPDARRALLDRRGLMAKVSRDKDGHGLGEPQRQRGRATYTFDVPGTPLRFLVMDTTSDAGGSGGMVRQSEMDTVLRPALEDAKTQGKLVILASHHGIRSLSSRGLNNLPSGPDAVEPAAWVSFLGNYPNVVFSLVGHSHIHAAQAIEPPGPALSRGFWEVTTSAIADFPNQFRVVEIWDGDNGHLILKSTVMDVALADDPVGREGIRRAIVDSTSGWGMPALAAGSTDDRNVSLWIPNPLTSPSP